ncbi:LysM peptidoglycan-binding domain-containing protein [Pseudomonas aeruginosa]|nr:hypothetical protein [Pseudomonas aeruginosa]MDP5927141.1 hypothetical protein [Pseudomonas aeruginosa]
MTKANECTCPSGDGSLRHPCPAHPALVEQAGGDERAAFRPAQVISYRPGVGEVTIYVAGRVPGYMNIGDTVYVSDRAPVEQPIAALAQPSPVRSSLLINGYQLRAALEFIAPDGTAKQLESEARIEWHQQDADFLEAGLYAWCAEYPEEGCVLLDEEPATAQPSPAQAEKAEVERPEVVATMYTHHDDVDFRELVVAGNCDKDCEGFYGPEKLMTVAQHERITAQLHDALDESDGDRWKLRSERDAALARVSELDKQCRDDVARALGLRPNEERGFAWSYLLASIKACVKVSENTAQAQHSVPAYVNYTTRPAESLAGIALRQLKDESRWVEIRDINAHAFPNMQSHSYYPAGTVIKLPAAAPGKSVPQAWLDVLAERRRQVEAEGWTPEHDDLYCAAELPRAAAAYILSGANDEAPAIWPFLAKWWKPRDARANYMRAGALILAEIERLDRAAAPGKEGV